MTDKYDEMALKIYSDWWPTSRASEKLIASYASALRQVAQEKERETLDNAIAACKGTYERRKADGLLGFNAIMQCVDAIRALSPTHTEDVSTPTELIDREYVRVPRDALEFYANPENYLDQYDESDGSTYKNVLADGGSLARKVRCDD